MKRFIFQLSIVLFVCLGILIPSSGVSNASDGEVIVVAQYRQDVEVTLDLSSPSEISSLDPAILSDRVSLEPVENLFLRLTDVDPVTNEVRPELATSWTISNDGLVWTFHLRDDVNWMRYDPASGNVATIRPVIADDFVFGIKRACDPRLGGYFGAVLATILAGCDVINLMSDENTTDELIYGDTTQVIAIDDTTLEIHLQFSAGYFLSMTTMWMMSPLPPEFLDEFGDDWTAAGNIVTNGLYFLEENVRGVRRVFVRNKALPADLGGSGNIDRLETLVIEDSGTAFALYQDMQLDAVGIPSIELQSVLETEEFSDQVYKRTDGAVFFFAYTHGKAPFENVHARRAFSAILDREAFIARIEQGRGVPMIHFTPPGMVNSPPIDEIGVGFNPEYAREQLALAGYPECEGFPNLDIITYIGTGTWAEFWAASAEEHLGCDPALFNIEQLDINRYEPPITPDTPVQDRPNAATQGWAGDYPDANGWVMDRLYCDTTVNTLQQLYLKCSDVDRLMEEAARETDVQQRAQLYLELEERLFGEDGEFPIVPIFLRASYWLYQPWFSGPFETDGIYGGNHWETWSVDMAAKLAARDAS